MKADRAVVIREMRSGEETMLFHAARRAFVHSPLELLGISIPQAALVAEVDGAVAGAMFLRVFVSGKRKTGYLDVGFVKKEYRGRGVGRALYPAAAEHLRAMGCDPIGAMVIDDNVASWKSLQNMGFGTPSLTEIVRLLGFGGALSLWLRTLLCVASGTRLWMSGAWKARSSAQEILAYVWVNLLLFLPGLLRYMDRPERILNTALGYLIVLLAGVLMGGIGCLAAGGTWRFSLPRGGGVISFVLGCLGTVFPMVGRWYPQETRATPEYRRAMGVQAAVEWVGMMGLFALGEFAFQGNAILSRCAALTVNLLLYRMIPLMPFGAFGGARVLRWSKVAFALLAVATAILTF